MQEDEEEEEGGGRGGGGMGRKRRRRRRRGIGGKDMAEAGRKSTWEEGGGSIEEK